uniref:Uncharacterized protein n=1 Tax=Meloidogyne floridensis TaxID=298350 RepID=A0A915NSR3_9BILA
MDYKEEKISKLLYLKFDEGKSDGLAADEVCYAFDQDVMYEEKVRNFKIRNQKNINKRKINSGNDQTVENKERKSAKKQKVNKPVNFGQTIQDGSGHHSKEEVSNLTNKHREPVSSHTSSNKNAESNHETNIPDNFFEGLEDYWKSFDKVNTEPNDFIPESEYSTDSIWNELSDMSNIASESNSISDSESTTTDKSKYSMELNEMVEDNLNFNWNDDEAQNLEQVGAAALPQHGPESSSSNSSSSSSGNGNPIGEIKFSLVELSFLIRILRELDPDYLIENAYDHTFHEVVMMTGSMILSKLGINNL